MGRFEPSVPGQSLENDGIHFPHQYMGTPIVLRPDNRELPAIMERTDWGPMHEIDTGP